MITFEASGHAEADTSVAWDSLIRTELWAAWDPALDRVEGNLSHDMGKRLPDLQPSFEDFVAGWAKAAEA